MRLWWLVVGIFGMVGAVGAVAGGYASAQAPARVIVFSMQRDGPPPVRYTLRVDGEGAGTYTPGDGASGTAGSAVPVHFSPAVLKRIFAAVPAVEGGRCETHSKSLAKLGAKTMHFTGEGHDAQCSYNYSDDERLNEATTTLQAIAETMQFGERLRTKLRFDRLGLDAELEALAGALASGQALEVGNIAPVLRAIDADDRVMERVHRRAETLLQGSGAAQPAGESER